MNYSLPGSSVHGILQARELEWVAIYLPNLGVKPSFPVLQADSFPTEPLRIEPPRTSGPMKQAECVLF